MSEPSSPRSFALGYLSSITGFKNPEDHTTEWFERAMAAARAEERRSWLPVVERAVADERERCARIADSYQVPSEARIPGVGDAIDTTAKSIAAHIRTEKIGFSEERTS